MHACMHRDGGGGGGGEVVRQEDNVQRAVCDSGDTIITETYAQLLTTPVKGPKRIDVTWQRLLLTYCLPSGERAKQIGQMEMSVKS